MTKTVGLSKEQIRRVALDKLRVVYRAWGMGGTPFSGAGTRPGMRRKDVRAFVVALVAALLGGLSEAIERNNRRLVAALARGTGDAPAKRTRRQRTARSTGR